MPGNNLNELSVTSESTIQMSKNIKIIEYKRTLLKACYNNYLLTKRNKHQINNISLMFNGSQQRSTKMSIKEKSMNIMPTQINDFTVQCILI